MTGPAADSTATRPARPASRPPRSGRGSSTTRKPAVAPKTTGSGNTPDMSGEESGDLSQDEFPSPSDSARSPTQASIKPESEDASGVQDDVADAPNMPLQKRRRVTRACDECRRKKIKCDGKQPCTHCSVYSYECTYDKPSNRRRNPAPQYIEALEARLQRAETLLRKFMPDVDLADPSLDPGVQQEFRNREKARARALELKMDSTKGGSEDNPDAQIMSMIESIGQLELKESGEWDFHGISSGAVFLRRMKEHFQTLLGNEYRIPFLPRPALPPGLFSLDSPKSSAGSPWDTSSVATIYNLPPLDRVRTLCYYSLDCATCLLRIVHRPTFFEMVDRLYATPQESWGNEEHRFLGLLYSVLALGCVYNVSQDHVSETPVTYKSAVEEGVQYYTSARLILQDVAECRDMASLQALVYTILFLQATSNISDCYAFLGIALRSCLRMGLHRHLSHDKITPIEDETRRRVFHVVRQMDFYVSAILGFPLLLHDEDVDQPLPTEVDDEYITKETIRMPPPGTPSFFQAFNAHNKLMRILAKVVKDIYPLRAEGIEGQQPNSTFMINYSLVQAIEAELQDWQAHLPDYWRPSHDGPIEVVRVRTLLRFGYAHVQMMLYRPFLHYISPRLTAGKKIEDRYYNCAAAGITVSRNIIHIGTEIQKESTLIGPYWFILYTEFFAILSLVFYVLENPDKPGSAEILADAKAGRDVIASLAQRSLAADRITTALNPLFEQLPERVKKTTTRPTPTKKRSAPAPSLAQGPRAGSATLPNRPDLQDGMPQRRSEEMVRPPIGLLRREARAPPQRTASFDTIGFQHGSLAGQTFTNLQDILPMNMPLTSTSSDTSSPQATIHRHVPGFQQGQTPGGPASSLYKMDAMMFPSEDPFAYPNQPLMDPTGHHGGSQASQPGAGQSHDTMQFYIPNMYDGIEGQLLEPIPSYLMQQGQSQGQRHPQSHGLSATPQMFNTSNMLAMQPDHGSHPHQQPQQHHQQMAQHPHQHPQQQHQQGSMMQEMLTDPNFRGDWDEMLGNTGYR